jgi:hypothetical protein
MLVASRIRMFGPACDFNARKMFAIAGAVAAEHDGRPKLLR